MAIPLLVVGHAYDGPSGAAVPVSSIEEAFEQFGGYAYEYLDLLATDTSAVLSAAPAGPVETFVESDGALVDYTLHNLTVTSNALAFSAPGDAVKVTVRYLRPFAATEAHKAYAEAKSAADIDVYIMRLGGERATATYADSDASYAITLRAQYAGTLYNTTKIEHHTDGSGKLWLKLTPPAGHGFARYYDLTSTTVENLADAINLDFDKGWGVVTASTTGTGTFTPPSSPGQSTLTGGTDGAYTAETIAAALEGMDLSEVGAITFAGMHFDDLSSVITESFLSELAFPTMFVLGMHTADLTSTAYATSLISSKTASHYLLTLVVGEGKYSYFPGAAYWSSLAPAYAAVLAQAPLTTTWKSLGVDETRPVFTESSLKSLASVGFAAATKSLSRSIVVFDGVTSEPTWRATHAVAYAATVSAVTDVLEPYVGHPRPERSEIEKAIGEALIRIPALHDFSYTLDFAPGVIQLDIMLRVLGEVRTIDFSIGVRTGNNAAPNTR